MNRLDDMRIAAKRTNAEAFEKLCAFPVLVSQFVAEGDLQKSTAPNHGIRGKTMQHVKKSSDLLLQPVARERWIGVFRTRDGFANPWLTVGRDRRSDVMINDYTISAVHAKLHFLPLVGRILLSDAGSTNATAHNGAVLRPDEQQMLVDGDQVRFGRMVFTFFRSKTFHSYLLGEWSPPATLV